MSASEELREAIAKVVFEADAVEPFFTVERMEDAIALAYDVAERLLASEQFTIGLRGGMSVESQMRNHDIDAADGDD